MRWLRLTRSYVLTSDGRYAPRRVQAAGAQEAFRLLSAMTPVMPGVERVEVEATSEVVWANGKFVWDRAV